MNVPRSQAAGVVLILFLLVLLMWARFLRHIFLW